MEQVMATDTDIKIASMETQLEQISKTLEELRKDIKDIAIRNETITTLQVQSESTNKNVETLWRKHDEIRDHNEEDHEDFKQFINQSKGSNKVIIGLISVFGAALLAGVGSLFYMLIEAKTINTVQSVEIEKLRETVNPSQPRTQTNIWRDIK